jgi:Spy/CpxP family protein refolding chaperone
MQHLELQKLMQDRDNLDYEKIRGALSTTSEARTEMFIERLKQRDEINKILTPEQRNAIKAMMKDNFGTGFRPMMESMRDREQRDQRFPRMRRRTIR